MVRKHKDRARGGRRLKCDGIWKPEARDTAVATVRAEAARSHPLVASRVAKAQKEASRLWILSRGVDAIDNAAVDARTGASAIWGGARMEMAVRSARGESRRGAYAACGIGASIEAIAAVAVAVAVAGKVGRGCGSESSLGVTASCFLGWWGAPNGSRDAWGGSKDGKENSKSPYLWKLRSTSHRREARGKSILELTILCRCVSGELRSAQAREHVERRERNLRASTPESNLAWRYLQRNLRMQIVASGMLHDSFSTTSYSKGSLSTLHFTPFPISLNYQPTLL